MTGQIGRPGTGLHPLRGQNNVQGASDSGPDPDGVPGLPARRQPGGEGSASRSSGARRSTRSPGLTVVEIMNAAHEGRDPRHVRHGREPGDVRPGRRPRARGAGEARAPGGAGHLPHRDRLPRRRRAAGDRLAGEGRHRHQHRPHGAARPQGARAAGRGARGPVDHPGDRAAHRASTGTTRHPRDVFNEMRKGMDSIAGITWERLERDSSVTYPCENEGDPGSRWCSPTHFPTATGRAQVRAGGHHPRGRAPGPGVPDGADHRPAARALAHRRDDAPRRRARRDRARAGRVDPPARPRRAEGRSRATS